MKYILTDIEGTTTSISFVHDELFPYSLNKLENYLDKNPECPAIASMSGSLEEKILQLKTWINTDQKEKPLKDLQGLIWKEGYLSGEIKGHLYPDVKEALTNWKKSGLELGVYSSGSIAAQKLLFKYSIDGDLDSFFSHNFDTSIGHKREVQSYLNIISKLNINAFEILFLSDIKEELDAAKLAGMKTIQLIRTGKIPFQGHPQVNNFSEIFF